MLGGGIHFHGGNKVIYCSKHDRKVHEGDISQLGEVDDIEVQACPNRKFSHEETVKRAKLLLGRAIGERFIDWCIGGNS